MPTPSDNGVWLRVLDGEDDVAIAMDVKDGARHDRSRVPIQYPLERSFKNDRIRSAKLASEPAEMRRPTIRKFRRRGPNAPLE